jgi:hypothetical protein
MDRSEVIMSGSTASAWACTSLAARLVWRRLPLLVVGNIVWLLASLPLVTWPAATAGLFALVGRIVQEELDAAPHETRLADFWDGFKRYAGRASLLTLLDVAGLGVIAVAFLFYWRSPVEPLRWLVGPIGLIGLVWLGAQLYVYPLLLQRPASGPGAIMREALLTAIGHPLLTFPLLLTSLALAVAAVALAGPVLLVFFSAMAMLQTVTLRQLLSERGDAVGCSP